MSALASLVHAYDRLAERGEAPVFGYSVEKIGFLISLNEDGTVAGPPIDLREGAGKRKALRLMRVPASFKRPGNTPKSFFLWDNTAFALGVSTDEKKSDGTRLSAFRERHSREIAGSNDAGLVALHSFINSWQPDDFVRLGWPEEMKDKNVVFALESERHGHRNSIYCIHDRPAARELWARISAANEKSNAICLITGENAPVARLHPAIKGIRSPGGGKDADSLVSFNERAFESYGQKQGDNAPVSEAAAFAYTTALNHFLQRDSGHRVQIGDASTVFWADASDAELVERAEGEFAFLMGVNEKVEEQKLNVFLEAARQGRPINDLPEIFRGVRFFVVGLSPNAARLSLRFYIEDDFGVIASNLAQHLLDLWLEPSPFGKPPAAWALLYETSVHVPRASPNGRTSWERVKKSDPPAIVSGDLMRAILTGARYPRTLLNGVVQRVRAEGGRITGKRVAICKAIINRDIRLSAQHKIDSDSEIPTRQETIPVALDRDNTNAAYRLGRLFALLEKLQELALPQLNATIRDRSFAGASTTPARVFPLLIKTSQHHASAKPMRLNDDVVPGKRRS